MTRLSISRTAVGFAFGLAMPLLGGCAPSERPTADATGGAEVATESSCDPFPGAPRAGGEIVVALDEPVSAAHAPSPANASERIVFRNLYETLAAVDCEGRVCGGLAESWVAEDSGRVWTFTLRRDARFWDGTPLDATDVKLSWMAGARRATTQRGAIWLAIDAAESVTVLDDRRLVARLFVAPGEGVAFFADPALAVADRRRGLAWPVGSGACRVAEDARADEERADEITCAPNAHRDGARPAWDRLVFRVRPGADARDLHDAAADVLLVRDRALLGYFGDIDALRVAALPWDRLYVFVTPMRKYARELDRGSLLTGTRARALGLSTRLNAELRDCRTELARDAVVSDAQPATSLLFTRDAARACDQPADFLRLRFSADSDGLRMPRVKAALFAAPLAPPHVAYPANDADARRLAERVAALGASELDSLPSTSPESPDLSPPVASGLPDDEFRVALDSADAFAFIVALDRGSPAPCAPLEALLAAVPWLRLPIRTIPLDDSLATRLAERGRPVPLVLTRPHLVARRDLVGIRVDYDGALRFDQAGWAAASVRASDSSRGADPSAVARPPGAAQVDAP